MKAKGRDGAKAIIINRDKMLLLKRRSVPFIINPGIWAFLGGGREENESHLETVYREIFEETGIEQRNLKLVGKPRRMALMNVKKPMERWDNMVFVFISKTSKVKINIENADYRWATYNQLKNGVLFTNEFVDRKGMLRMVKSALGK